MCIKQHKVDEVGPALSAGEHRDRLVVGEGRGKRLCSGRVGVRTVLHKELYAEEDTLRASDIPLTKCAAV